MLNDIELLPIDKAHVFGLMGLATVHKDPFDRMLASQCLVESTPILSADPVFEVYGVMRIW